MKAPQDSNSAKERFIAAFGRFFLNCVDLDGFYSTTLRSLDWGKLNVESEWNEAAQEALEMPQLKGFLREHWEGEPKELLGSLAQAMAKRSVRLAKQTVDSATLVFAHTLLDEILLDCCQISFLACPEAWYQFVTKRKVELGAVLAGSGEQLIRQAAWEEICSLRRESMQKRLERLNQVCIPRLKAPPGPTAWIELEELNRFDRLRHGIVHGKAFSKKVPKVENLAAFGKRAGFSALMLVCEAHDLHLDEGVLQAESPRSLLRLLASAKREFPEFVDLFESRVKMLSFPQKEG